MIKVTNLVKRYKNKLALDHFSFESNKNQIIGLLGPNGCGKSTAIHCMLSILKYDNGEIKLFNQPINSRNREIKRKIGIVPQEIALFERLNVYENIDFFCGLYIEDKQQRSQYVEEAIQFVGLDKYRKFMPKQLSGGLKRRLNIACGIAHKPELVFMDEPTVAVDAQSRHFILEGVKKMRDDGVTVVYTTHYLDEAESLCDYIVIMDAGRNIAEGSLHQLQQLTAIKERIIINFVGSHSNIKELLNQIPHVKTVNQNEETTIIEFDKENNLGTIVDFMATHNMTYTEISTEKPSLSDIFFELTGKELRDE